MSRPPRRRIALVFGGRSAEHEISVVSAESVLRALKISREASAILIYAADTEQGYRVEVCGSGNRRMRDFDGLWLVGRVQERFES